MCISSNRANFRPVLAPPSPEPQPVSQNLQDIRAPEALHARRSQTLALCPGCLRPSDLEHQPTRVCSCQGCNPQAHISQASGERQIAGASDGAS